MIKFKNMQFMAEDDGGGGGGGGGEPAADPGQQQQAPTIPQFDPKAIASEFASVLDERDQKRAASQPKTYTPEQIAEARRALKFWEPDDNFIKDFGNLETQKQAFVKLRDGLMDQFSEVTKAMLAQQEEAWQKRFEPFQKELTIREEREREGRFYENYPVLKDSKLKPVLTAVGTQLAQQGKFNGLTEEQAFAALAQGVESVLQVSNPDFKLGAGTSPAASVARNGNSIPVTSSGSGGGGGGASNGGGSEGAKPLPKAASLFSKIRG